MAFLRCLRRLLMLALVAGVGMTLALVYVLPHLPPEDLPWTPLDLDAPVGLATAGKIAALDGPQCRTLLDQAGIAYHALPDIGRAHCRVRGGIAWPARGRRGPRYRPSAPPLACPLAAALAVWEREVVQPAAERRFGVRVAAIEHFGSYSCRRLYGRPAGDWSEHAYARAIDIGGFVLADGRRVAIARDWGTAGIKGLFLRDLRQGACRLFATTLSPDYNPAHRDHFHLDEAPRGSMWRTCR
ncbi:MAG TPA: extensin family protein [Sphingomonas sp.]|nr:extensin family protein [Sphingomonas sp.]